MARVSTKENKNVYHKTREALQLTREEASDLLESISPERIEKIENERSLPHPDEVLVMADKYKQPNLCNYYCANQCPIGQQYVPEIKVKDLSQIVLEMLASLNSMTKQKERFIEITVDGKISGDELEDFIYIQEELERIIAFADKLSAAPTTGVDATAHIVPMKNVLRDDVVEDEFTAEELLAAATTKHGVYIVVPRVVED